MSRWLWLKGAFFMVAVWGAWAVLDRPILMATRRPSSVWSEDSTIPPAIRSCSQRAMEIYPNLAKNVQLPGNGIFEDNKTFSRSLRVAWSGTDYQWKLQQLLPAATGKAEWQSVAKFWDVDGDSYPDEAVLLIDPSKLQDWERNETSVEWSYFTAFNKDGDSWAWSARLDAMDWSLGGECYAWANPVVSFVNWAVMIHRWNPSLAIATAVAENKKPASIQR